MTAMIRNAGLAAALCIAGLALTASSALAQDCNELVNCYGTCLDAAEPEVECSVGACANRETTEEATTAADSYIKCITDLEITCEEGSSWVECAKSAEVALTEECAAASETCAVAVPPPGCPEGLEEGANQCAEGTLQSCTEGALVEEACEFACECDEEGACACSEPPAPTFEEDAPCPEGLDYIGTCENDVLWWCGCPGTQGDDPASCPDAEPITFTLDCPGNGATCGFNEEAGFNDCIPGEGEGGEGGEGGSCAGFCNAQSADGCYCDPNCVMYGDCCPDFQDECPEEWEAAQNGGGGEGGEGPADPCGGVTFEGECQENTVVWCENGLQSADCDLQGLYCGQNDQGIFDCLEEGCGDGVCQDNETADSCADDCSGAGGEEGGTETGDEAGGETGDEAGGTETGDEAGGETGDESSATESSSAADDGGGGGCNAASDTASQLGIVALFGFALIFVARRRM